MGTFSMSHWLIVLLVVVLLFGAKKIPELAKGVGQGIKDFKKVMNEKDAVIAGNEAQPVAASLDHQSAK